MSKFTNILSIAGSDPSGGAGIQADLKTIMGLQGYGMAIPTMLTVQNTQGVKATYPLSVEILKSQILYLLEDIRPDAIKIGALGSFKIAQTVVDCIPADLCPVVWDPVLVSSSGKELLASNEIQETVELMTAFCTLATPNHHERILLQENLCPLLITHGEYDDDALITDRLHLTDGQTFSFVHPRLRTTNTHGTGCTLSTAIATHLGRGLSLVEACREGIRYCTHLLEHSSKHSIGSGRGPLGHEFYSRSYPK